MIISFFLSAKNLIYLTMRSIEEKRRLTFSGSFSGLSVSDFIGAEKKDNYYLRYNRLVLIE
jgi:hypothetical protein